MLKRFIEYMIRAFIAFFAISILMVCFYRFISPPLTPLMFIRIVDGLFEGEPAGLKKEWAAYDETSPNLFRAVIAAEDARFFSHHGIDWKAVEKARKYNERHKGKKVRGASTITMQTARNTFLWHDKNWIRKGLEVYFTYLIDFIWGKERVLEVYVNIIEWGGGIYGAEAAAEKYFRRTAAKLTRNQAALMAAVLPNPRRWSPAKPTSYILKRRATIKARMNAIALPKKNR